MKKDSLDSPTLSRRTFVQHLAAGVAGVTAVRSLGQPLVGPGVSVARRPYRGPNVIVIRFGGGVRRRETIDPQHTYSPFLCRELTRRGVLFKNMEIEALDGVETSHGQGTLYILTGKYDRYKDIEDKFLGERFEAKVPTVFEYFRKSYDVPEHQTLIINGEDRKDEEFYSFSNHTLYGVRFRCNVLSLFRFKTFLLRRQLEAGHFSGRALQKKGRELAKMEALDYRTGGNDKQRPELLEFWERWRHFYGDSGFVNPRGDRLLTELTVRALAQLRPRLLMVNYNDPDYVHWGNKTHYTRGISIIDQGIQRILAAVESDEEYRDNTVFFIVPDCGRDSNPFAPVPYQHHFNSRSAHEIFALAMGPGLDRAIAVDHAVNQISVAATIGQIMGFPTGYTEGPVLEETFA